MKMKWIATIPLIAFIIVTGLLIWKYSPEQQKTTPQLKNFYPVPNFTLTERSERQVSNTDLLGNIWIVNFIFTNCHDSCPIQSAKMALLQKHFQEDPKVKLISITVDPEYDTPKVLRPYADQFEADPEKWLFLTGSKEKIRELVIKGFKLAVIENADNNSDTVVPKEQSLNSSKGMESIARLESLSILFWNWIAPSAAYAHQDSTHFLHSDRFVLVDQKGDIRGYFHSNKQDIGQLKKHVRFLINH